MSVESCSNSVDVAYADVMRHEDRTAIIPHFCVEGLRHLLSGEPVAILDSSSVMIAWLWFSELPLPPSRFLCSSLLTLLSQLTPTELV